jgi:hypothetical protein
MGGTDHDGGDRFVPDPSFRDYGIDGGRNAAADIGRRWILGPGDDLIPFHQHRIRIRASDVHSDPHPPFSNAQMKMPYSQPAALNRQWAKWVQRIAKTGNNLTIEIRPRPA